MITSGRFGESQEPGSKQICKAHCLGPPAAHSVLQDFSRWRQRWAWWQVLLRAACVHGAVQTAPPAGPAHWFVPPVCTSCASLVVGTWVARPGCPGGTGGEWRQGCPGWGGHPTGHVGPQEGRDLINSRIERNLIYGPFYSQVFSFVQILTFF